MKLIKHSVVVLLLAMIAILQSCGNDNDPAFAPVEVQMKATTTQSSIKNGRTMNADLTFNEVLIGVTELEFETLEEDEMEDSESETEDESDDNDEVENEDDSDDDNEEVEFEGEFVVDLINGTSTPDFGIADLAPGIYKEIEIEMEPILEGGNTIFISFEFTNLDEEVVTVEYSNSAELEFEIESESGYVLDEGATNHILVLLNLDSLFEGIDLNGALADEDGIVRINSSSNADLAAAIAANLDQVFEAGEDDDEDGEFDDD